MIKRLINAKKCMMSINEVQNYFENMSNSNELIKELFEWSQYPQIVDTVMKSLKLTPKQISDSLLMDDSEFSMKYMVIGNVVAMFEKLESIVGEQAFVKLMLKTNNEHKINALEVAINKKKVSILECFMSFDGIKKEYESNKQLMALCVFHMNKFYDESVVSVILNAFNWNKEKLKVIQSWY